MGYIDDAVAWAVAIANDDTHGYSQNSRWGPNYDCSSLIIQAWEEAGIPVKTNGATYTGNMYLIFIGCGFQDVTNSVNLDTGEGLQKGDVLLNTGKHCEMMISTTQKVGAHWDYDNVTGDGSGNEINITNYSNYPYQYVLRYPETPGTYNWIVYDTDEAGKMSQADQENNVKIIFSILYSEFGWTREAIAGALGSMQHESYFNPGQWELGHKTETVDGYGYAYGYGLIQWTRPYSTYPNPYLNYCYENNVDRLDGTEQVRYLNTGITSSDLWGWIPTSAYQETFSAYKSSNKSPEYLASVWFHNLERPPASDTTEPARKASARYWYDFLAGVDPIKPSDYKKQKGMSLLLMAMATKGF